MTSGRSEASKEDGDKERSDARRHADEKAEAEEEEEAKPRECGPAHEHRLLVEMLKAREAGRRLP